VLTQGTIVSIQKKGLKLDIHGRGDIHVICSIKGREDRFITLRDVAYCPDARDNLISESRMDRKGLEIRKRNGKVSIIKDDGEMVMQGSLQGGLYVLDCILAPDSSRQSDVAFSAHYERSLDIWHRRLAHINENGLRYLAKHDLVTGLDIQTNGSLGPCDGCAKGKHHQAPFPKDASRATNILERLHMDLQGPFDTSIQGFRFTLGVIDDNSRMGWKRYLKLKSEASEEIQALITKLETYTGRKVKIVRIDGGGEFLDGGLRDWFKSKGITLEISAPDTQQQNGVAERFNQTTHERALAMLEEAGMSKGFWPEAHQYSNHVRNRSPTSALTRTTPYEVFYNKKPDVSTLRVFGSRCHVRLPKDKRGKLDAHSLDGILCGFAHRSKAYKVWIPSRHKFKTSRDVIVYEKIPEHDEEPVITSTSGEGVTQDKSASSEGFTKAPAIVEESRQPDKPPPTTLETPSIAPETSIPTQPAPMRTISADIPAPPPIPIQPCRSERTIRPTWVKAAADAQKSHALDVKATNKAVREARVTRRELRV